MSRKKESWLPPLPPPAPSPFAALAGMRDQLPAQEPAAGAPGAPVLAAKVVKGPARAVVRLERKGKGGKETTIVDKLELAPVELERWCKELKAALGCGGVVDGATIVLQGDLRARMEAVLLGRGVRKVTIA